MPNEIGPSALWTGQHLGNHSAFLTLGFLFPLERITDQQL